MKLSDVKSNPLVLRAVVNLLAIVVLFVGFGVMVFTGAGQFCPFLQNSGLATVWFVSMLVALCHQLTNAEKQLRQALILSRV